MAVRNYSSMRATATTTKNKKTMTFVIVIIAESCLHIAPVGV